MEMATEESPKKKNKTTLTERIMNSNQVRWREAIR